MISFVAATGDAGDINCWSGIPYHFAVAAGAAGLPAKPWRLDLNHINNGRRWWNLRQFLFGRGIGGYQYSDSFLSWAEAAIPLAHWEGRILSFNQHFPRSQSASTRNGRMVRYLDATFASFCHPGGLADSLPVRVRERARALERENYALSEFVVTMSRWAAESVTGECGVDPRKVATILPGANLLLASDFRFSCVEGAPGIDRPLSLGFVGKDWKRKGLPFLMQVRNELERMDVMAVVKCAGVCPAELSGRPGIEYVGFIDKAREPARFLEFLTSCDVGCLFSTHEPLGISTLEFLRAGVPVAGFINEGVADTIPPDAGFRFPLATTASEVASTLKKSFRDAGSVDRLRLSARAWSPLVTWERCVNEWRELLLTGKISQPVQLWRSLPVG